MKNSKVCPKCEESNIIKVPSSYVNDQDSILLGILNYGEMNYYVCADCGYVEQWVDNEKSLEQLKLYFGEILKVIDYQ